MNDFGKKIDWEYEMFYLDIMRTSKANIFAKSGEIEAKKKIIEALRKIFRERKKTELQLFEKLSGFDSVLDEVYRYILDSAGEKTDIQIQVEEWVSTIQNTENVWLSRGIRGVP